MLTAGVQKDKVAVEFLEQTLAGQEGSSEGLRSTGRTAGGDLGGGWGVVQATSVPILSVALPKPGGHRGERDPGPSPPPLFPQNLVGGT